MLQPASIFERVHQGMNHLKAAFQNPVQKLNQHPFKGQSLVETSLVMGLVGVVCIGTVATLGGNISSLISEANGTTAPTTALVTNTQLVNTNLGAPNATTGAGFISGQNPLGTTGGNTQNTVETVTAAGSTAQEGPPPDENVIENTNPGGPIGPVVIQANTNPSGSGAGSAVTKPTLTPQQQFSPEYQAWRNNPNNAKTVAMIDSLSPDGQKIANTYYNSMALGDGRDPLQVLLSDGSLKQSDWTIVNDFRNSAFALVRE